MERGCSFFQVHLLEFGVITDSLLDGSRLIGSLRELVLNPFKFSPSHCDFRKLLTYKYFKY